jgi:hypothetical protein
MCARAWFVLVVLVLFACRGDARQPVGRSEQFLSRTEFTDRIENFFEYEPLRAGRASQFRIHLTDLSEGTPVAKADVSLKAWREQRPVVEIRAHAGANPGIYVADVTIPERGTYQIEFQITSGALDETMRLSGFSVE